MEVNDSSASSPNNPVTTIENLSDDILWEIFNYLNKTALVESSKVCQRWHNVIVNSKILNLRPTLFIKVVMNISSMYFYREYYKKFYNNLLKSSEEFPYRNFKIFNHVVDFDEFWDEFGRELYGFIKNPLKLELLKLPRYIQSKILESSVPTLTHLCMDTLSFPDPYFDLPFEFPNLVYLKLCYCAFPMSISAPNLKELDYRYPDFKQVVDEKLFTEFLCKFKHLKKLATFIVPKFDKNQVKLQLEELQLFLSKVESEDLKMFLKSQHKSLKNLRFSNIFFVNGQDFFTFIAQHLRLEKLDVYGSLNIHCDHDNEFDYVNFSVKKLKIDFTSMCDGVNSEYAIMALRKFQGVEELDCCTMTHLVFILDYLQDLNLIKLHLEFSWIESLNDEKFSQYKFEKLTELTMRTIGSTKDVKNLIKITSFCPNLKTLKICQLESSSSKIQFKKFHFECLFKFSPHLDDFVIEKCQHLTSSFMFNIKTVKSNLIRLKVGVEDCDKIGEMMKKLANAKFLCDIHYFDIPGMKNVDWNWNENKPSSWNKY